MNAKASTGKLDLKAVTHTMLNISTGMVPKGTGDALGKGSGPLFDALAYVPFFEYGWIVFVPPAAHDGTNEEVEELGHAELGALLRFARQHGFDYLKLDEGGLNLDGFPTFEW